MVREFMLPNYRRIRQFADSHNIAIVSVDTDGDCSELVPLFMEAGINMMLPFEVQAGCDVREYAQKYPELCIMGGFNKQALWTSAEAIDQEFNRLSPMFAPGVRWIPAPDHLIPPEVPYELFKHFMIRLKELVSPR
jgi:uroporphyrinogen decarboxylase